MAVLAPLEVISRPRSSGFSVATHPQGIDLGLNLYGVWEPFIQQHFNLAMAFPSSHSSSSHVWVPLGFTFTAA